MLIVYLEGDKRVNREKQGKKKSPCFFRCLDPVPGRGTAAGDNIPGSGKSP